MGEEIFSGRVFKERLSSLAYSRELNRATVCGEVGLKVMNMTDFSEIEADGFVLEDVEENEAHAIAYAPEAQILTVATLGGIVQNFLARMPNVTATYKTYVAYLSSLRELAIVDTLERRDPIQIKVSIEPSFLALGPGHVAVGMNNRVWFYRCDGEEEPTKGRRKVTSSRAIVNEQEYLGSVESVRLNKKYAAIYTGGKVIVHAIEPEVGHQEKHKVFPEGDHASVIQSVAMTSHYLIYGTQDGSLQVFYFRDWSMLHGSAYRHDEAIVHVSPNPQGTSLRYFSIEFCLRKK